MGDRDPIPHLDLYAELEVEPGATVEAIEAAYRAQMKRSHPDLAGPAGLERSKRLNLARDWLTDPGRRARYDASRRASAGGPGSPEGGPGAGAYPAIDRRPARHARRRERRPRGGGARRPDRGGHRRQVRGAAGANPRRSCRLWPSSR